MAGDRLGYRPIYHNDKFLASTFERGILQLTSFREWCRVFI